MPITKRNFNNIIFTNNLLQLENINLIKIIKITKKIILLYMLYIDEYNIGMNYLRKNL